MKVIRNYTKQSLDHISLELEPELIEGCKVDVVSTDTDGTVYVLIKEGEYAETYYWFLEGMVFPALI